MKSLVGKITLLQLLILVAIIACAGLAMAGVIHPALGTLPLLPMIGAVKVRDAMDNVRTIKYTHSSATTADTVYLLNGRVMLAMNSALANTANIFMIGGTLEYTTDTGAAWVGGDKIYWDNTAFKFTKTVGTNTLCGIACEDKASATATACILLVPTP